MADLPTGTVTFLFTDVEGSTALWEADPKAMGTALARHDELLRAAFRDHDGHIFATSGDGFAVVFRRVQDAAAAAVAAQLGLTDDTSSGPALQVRMGIHTGEAEERDGDYFGPTLNETGRLLGAGHGGQVLVSGVSRELLGTRVPQGAGIADLGEHRLRDVERPFRIWQITHPELAADFPALRTMDHRRDNLPTQVTSFVGRHQELAELDKLIRGARLVTVIGAGGSGKTRLAIEAAAGLVDEFPDGIWFADLAPMEDPSRVIATVARAMGLAEPGGADPVQSVVTAVESRTGLAVLDNCEHVLAEVRAVVAGLMRGAPSIRLLATSREALALQGEVVSPLPPFRTPSEDATMADLRAFDAIRLFEERGDAARPGFRLTPANGDAVRRICRRLDGIPLGIELAAARLRVLSPEELARRLDDSLAALGTAGTDIVPHHRTLEATLEWSFGLLDEDERLLLARLSVFSGGWALEAAEEVAAGNGIDASAVLDLLGSLVDKSLVVVGEGPTGTRYRLLEPVRQYALGKAADMRTGEEVPARHAAYFAQLVENGFHELVGPDEVQWLDRLEADIDNIRQALDWHLDSGNAQGGQLMAGALYRFWARTRRRYEAEEWRTRMLAADQTPGQSLARTLLIGSFFDGYRLGEAVDLYRQFGPPEELAIALHNRGVFAIQQDGDWRLASRLYQEALEINTAQDRFTGFQTITLAGIKMYWEGDLDAATALLGVAVPETRRFGSANLLHSALQHLGDLELQVGDLEAATRALEEALALEERPGARIMYVGGALVLLAQVAMQGGDPDLAIEQLDRLHHQIEGIDYGEPASRRNREAPSLRVRGEAEVARGRHHRGVVLLAADAAQRESQPWGGVLPPPYQRSADAAIAKATEALDDVAFQSSWAEGSAMSLEKALAYGASEISPSE
jgi:predicted ATPase/class 3 adenylate cyclase